MEKTKRWFALFPLVLVGILTSAYSCTDLAALGEDFTFEESASLSNDLTGVQRIVIQNTLGSVSVSGWDQANLQLSATKRAKTQKDLEKITFDVVESDGQLLIKTQHPQHEPTRWLMEYTLLVPYQMQLDVQQGAGDIMLKDIEGAIHVELGVGDFFSEHLMSGDLNLELGTGDAHLRGLVGDRMDAKIGVGELELAPQTAQPFTSVRVEVGTGSAILKGIQAQVISVDVGVGEVDLGLFQNASFNFSASVGMGKVSAHGFDSLHIKKKRFWGNETNGTLGNGEGTLRAHVGMGEIHIHPFDLTATD